MSPMLDDSLDEISSADRRDSTDARSPLTVRGREAVLGVSHPGATVALPAPVWSSFFINRPDDDRT